MIEDLYVLDPLRREMTKVRVEELLRKFDPLTPEEYEKYYKKALKPLLKSIEELNSRLRAIERSWHMIL
jgi:hypothetical protein